MYVPTLNYGLISITKLDKDGYRTHFRNKKDIIYDKKNIEMVTGRIISSQQYQIYKKNKNILS
jgi:hypothetical protein